MGCGVPACKFISEQHVCLLDHPGELVDLHANGMSAFGLIICSGAYYCER